MGFRGVLKKFNGYLKEVAKVFKESVKCLSRKFQKKKFQGCFKNVSMKFCFVIWSCKKEGLFE